MVIQLTEFGFKAEAVNFLRRYYKVRKMRILLNGRKVGNRYVAYYSPNRVHFTKRGLTNRQYFMNYVITSSTSASWY